MTSHQEAYNPLESSTENDVPVGIPVSNIHGQMEYPEVYSAQIINPNRNHGNYYPHNQTAHGTQGSVQTRLGELERDWKNQNLFVIANWVVIGLIILIAIISTLSGIFISATSNNDCRNGDKPSRPQNIGGPDQHHQRQNDPLDSKGDHCLPFGMLIVYFFLILGATTLGIGYHYLGIRCYKSRSASGMRCLFISYIVFVVLSVLSLNIIGAGLYSYLAYVANRLQENFKEAGKLEENYVEEQRRADEQHQGNEGDETPQSIQLAQMA